MKNIGSDSFWLNCFKSQGDVLDDFKWERAKSSSKNDLANIRKELMNFRGKYLEGRRMLFSKGMQEVWSCLREDTYSAFSNLQVPEPKGKGFPVVLEVKATLDDGIEAKEIDALKVFSESQVNALGVAAFVNPFEITRARLVNLRRSRFNLWMKTISRHSPETFLPPILDEGRQVILLTHNETFARDISYWHHERSNYVTLRVRMSPKGRAAWSMRAIDGLVSVSVMLRNWPRKGNLKNPGYVSVLQLNVYTQ